MPQLADPGYWTAELVRALPEDGRRYEVVRGELLVTPAPRLWHQEIVVRLLYQLREYLRSHPEAHVLASPADISWADDVLVQPDLFVVPLAQARTLDWTRLQDLLLAIEVLSPSSARADRFTKRVEYQRHGVETYWIVDPERRVVEVWHPADTLPQLMTERLTWHPVGATAGLVVDLAELFQPL